MQKGTKNGAYTTVAFISFSFRMIVKYPAKNIIPAANPPRNKYTGISQCQILRYGSI